MTEWIDAAAASDVLEGEVIGVAVRETPIALFRLADEVFALRDLCSHGHARLSEGFVEGDCVECPLHQGLVGIRDGSPCSAPITEPVQSIPARIVGDRIEVSL
jgi:nitrite reductase/ring-hydroxylating ferredoxin subunit